MSGYIISKKQVPSLPTLKGFGYTASRYNRIPRTDSRRLMLTAEEKKQNQQQQQQPKTNKTPKTHTQKTTNKTSKQEKKKRKGKK